MLENQLVKLSETLKKAPDILGKRSKYRNAAVMITLCYLKGDWYLLFERRKPGIPQGGEVCFPGGTFDSAEDTFFKDTAVRETAEELGIRPEQVRISRTPRYPGDRRGDHGRSLCRQAGDQGS